jgi:hypothetical protein
MSLKLWEIYHPNYMIVIVLAETEKDAIRLAKEANEGRWSNAKLSVTLLCSDLTVASVCYSGDVI